MFSWGTKIQITFHVECSEKNVFTNWTEEVEWTSCLESCYPWFCFHKNLCFPDRVIPVCVCVCVFVSVSLCLYHIWISTSFLAFLLYFLSISTSLLLPPLLYLLWRPILASFLSQLYDEFLVNIVQGCCSFAAVVTFSGSRKSDAKLMRTGHSHGAC